MEENTENKTDKLLEGTIWERNNNDSYLDDVFLRCNIHFLTKITGELINNENKNLNIPFNYSYENSIIEIYAKLKYIDIIMKSYIFNKNDNTFTMNITITHNESYIRENIYSDILYKKIK